MMRTDNGAGFRARVTSAFRGVRDGEIHPRQWAPGDEISGDLAREAVAGGHAVQIGVALENKASEAPIAGNPQTGLTGAGERSSSRRQARASVLKISKPRGADAS